METKYKNKNPYQLYTNHSTKLNEQNKLNKKYISKTYLAGLAKQDAISSNNGTHGNFMCPNCKHYYNLSYGRYGKISTFQDPCYYCVDCVKLFGNKFVKMG